MNKTTNHVKKEKKQVFAHANKCTEMQSHGNFQQAPTYTLEAYATTVYNYKSQLLILGGDIYYFLNR